MKWIFYVIVFIYLYFRLAYAGKSITIPISKAIAIEKIDYGTRNFLQADTHVAVNCKVFVKGKTVEWVNTTNQVVERVPTNRVYAHEHFTQMPKGGRSPALVLTFKKIRPRDSGVYECRSKGVKDFVNICVIDPLQFVNTPAEVSAVIGRSITLSCQATGDPEPRIIWRRNGTDIHDETENSKYKVMTKYNSQGFEGLLTVTSLEPDDSGDYYCIAIQENTLSEGCAYSETLNITLNVNYKPTFEDGNDTKLVYGKNNESVDIICSARGYPTPTYKWFQDVGSGTLKQFDEKQIVFNEDENQYILKVTGGPDTFGQRYKCQASNELGTSEKYFTLLQIEKPPGPSTIEVHRSTDKKIELSLTWSEEVLFPIDSFEIQYVKTHLKNPDWKKPTRVVVDAENVGEADPESNGILISISGLDEETKYAIRLRAVNDAGASSWSGTISASTKVKEVTEATEVTKVTEPEKTDGPVEENVTEKAELTSDGTFYGIFFAGGIIIVAVVCMFAMRVV